MKKRAVLYICVTVVVLLSFLYLFRNTGRSKQTESLEEKTSGHNLTKFLISKEIEVDCSEGFFEFENDTHGGFHNDGIAFYIIEFENSDILNDITLNEYWSELPPDEELVEFIEGRVIDEMGKPYFLPTEEGYYFFYNRSSGNEVKGFTPGTLEGHPGNFTIAIYDPITNKLYYCMYDS